MPPASAVTRLTSIEFLKALRYGSWKISRTFAVVNPPSSDSKAPSSTCPAGRSRKSTA